MSEQEDHEHEIVDGLTIDEIEEYFQALANEIKGKPPIVENLQVDKVEESTPSYRNYNPTIFDFLARATTEEECNEIIDYCLSKDEITLDQANELREKMEIGGPKIFGDRKPGHYHK